MDKKEMKEVLENCSNTQRQVTDGWDTSSLQKGCLHNHMVDIQTHKSTSVSELTVDELKLIIRQIIREEIQLNKGYYPHVQPLFRTEPDWVQPWWNQPVTCTTDSVDTCTDKNRIGDI